LLGAVQPQHLLGGALEVGAEAHRPVRGAALASVLERAADDLDDGTHPVRSVPLGQFALERGKVAGRQGGDFPPLAQPIRHHVRDVTLAEILAAKPLKWGARLLRRN
jgi:hypothetical protein